MDYPTDKRLADRAIELAKAAAAGVPLVGGSASSLIGDIVTPPLTKRRERWLADIGLRVARLEDQAEGTIDRLQKDERFLDVVLEASSAADRTSNETKREALAAIVVNTAKGQSPDEATAAMFIAYIRDWTDWHIKLMDLFSDPVGWFHRRGRKPKEYYSAARASVLRDAMPELIDQQKFYELVWSDIHRAGMTRTNSLHGNMTGSGVYEPCLSSRGVAFMRFITDRET